MWNETRQTEPTTTLTDACTLSSFSTYVSADEVERADAFDLGYNLVCQHPCEVGILEVNAVLVVDFNHILFDDQELAVIKINEASQRGVLVGIHTYYRGALSIHRLRKPSNLLVADTHQELLFKLGQYAKLCKHPWHKIATVGKPLIGDEPNTIRTFVGSIPQMGSCHRTRRELLRNQI